MKKHIAIIGGGVSGSSTVIQLIKAARSAGEQIDISIFNSTPEFGTGLPYNSTVANRFLLNHESTDMGGIKVDAEVGHDDFYNWLQQNIDKFQPLYPGFDLTSRIEYLPRNLYGKYVKERYEEAKALAQKNGMTIHEVTADVVNVEQLRQKLKVTYNEKNTGNSKENIFDKVVLALGHTYAPSASQIESSGHFFKPQQLPALLDSGKAKGKSIIIQGAGQYADEMALALLDAGAANVKMISRHGWLHAVRGRYEPYERKFLTLENLEARSGKNAPFKLADVVDLLKQELEHATGKPIDWNAVWLPQNIPEKLERDIAFAESGAELKWRSVLLSLKGIRQQIFERLDSDDKKKFTHEYRALFFSYQAPIPVKIAKRLLAAMKEGRLEVLGGWQTSEWLPDIQKMRVSRVTHNGGSHDATQPVSDQSFQTLEADYLVSGNGQTLNASHIPLIKSMIESGTLVSNPNGGIRANLANQHVFTEQGESPHIFALGPITNGERLISSNAHSCMESGLTIANTIMQEISASKARTQRPANTRTTGM